MNEQLRSGGLAAYASELVEVQAACALEFERGELGVYQILASKRAAGGTSLPLTRRHLYV